MDTNINTIHIEDLSYIGDSFVYNKDIPHYSQMGLPKIKVVLLFTIPGTGNTQPVEEQNGQNLEHIPRFAGVKVPKNLPILRLRQFVRHCETQLIEVYGTRVKRVNFLLIYGENTGGWSYTFEMPTYQVAFD